MTTNAESLKDVDLEKEQAGIGKAHLGSHGTGIDAVLPYTRAEEKALVWKQDSTIIPLCAFIYFLCYLDRANIGNARILNSTTHNGMQEETHTTDNQFTIALMLFLIAYAIFEVPSNMLLKKLRPSRWIAFLMFSWGATTMGLGGSKNFADISGVRFLLGCFEAGLFPGLIYYLTFWYKHDERSGRCAFILASATLAGAFGGAIAFGVGHMNGAGGLSAWRWLFILEGLPSCLSAILVFFFLPDFPEEWKKLSTVEKDLAVARLALEASKSSDSTMSWRDAVATLTDWRLYGHYAIYFAVSTPFSSVSYFSPSIVAGLGYKDLQAQLMTVPPYAVAYVVQILASFSADHFNARGFHIIGLAILGFLGFIIAAELPADAFAARYGCLIIAMSGMFATIPSMLGWISSNVYNTASVGLAIAINVSTGGGIGQIPGVWIYKSTEAALGYPTGHRTNAGMMIAVAVGAAGLRIFYGWKNKQLRKAHPDGTQIYKL